MKLQLDYDNKILKIENQVNLGKFIDKILEIIDSPGEWEILTNTEIIRWQNPIIIEKHVNPYRQFPWYESPVLTSNKIIFDEKLTGIVNYQIEA